LKKGWNLIGLPNAIKKTPKELFSNYMLWEYKNGQWRLSSDCGCDLSKNHLVGLFLHPVKTAM